MVKIIGLGIILVGFIVGCVHMYEAYKRRNVLDMILGACLGWYISSAGVIIALLLTILFRSGF